MPILLRCILIAGCFLAHDAAWPCHLVAQSNVPPNQTNPPRATQLPATAQDAPQTDGGGELSVEEIRALLRAINPYLPQQKITTEVDLFGSTSMDAMAHNWATAFKRFHPEATVTISAKGTESVFEELGKKPGSIGMMSRPVSPEDLDRLKSLGLKNPVAVQVARDALGVYVNESNPLTVISYPQLVQLFCQADNNDPVTWGRVGVTGPLADQPVHVVGRPKSSGTRTFIDKYLFHKHQLRAMEQELSSNAEAIEAVSQNPQAITIGELKISKQGVRRLKLRDNDEILDADDHQVLLGRYPITRPMTLVFDLGNAETAGVNCEFIRFTLSREGQTKAILAGLFPYDPPTLRAQMAKLEQEPGSR